ncbi:MAG: DNA-3-methyladenine glycosylase 2 family protein [Nocardioides sp.]
MSDIGSPAELRWRPSWPCSVGSALRIHRRGGGDPTYKIDEAGVHWRGIRTPDGPATLAIAPAREGEVRARAWGDGASWALESVPRLLGADDDPAGFEARHPAIAEGQRRYPDLRFGRSDRVMEALIPAILEQKVTGKEAFGGFRSLVHRYGERAPGPGGPLRLWVQPAPARIATVPSWEWLKMHVDPARSRAIVTVCRVADSLERLSSVRPEEADRKLRSLPGIGVWTSAEVRQRAFGDPDAVSFGDYHLAKEVGWALLGHDIDDQELAEVLEPYRPHRGRAATYALLGGVKRPRRGPRMSLPTHYPTG